MATDLLDLLREAEHAADPRATWVHVLLPNMGYVCDGGPLGLADGGPSGRWTLGANERDWPTVTCPDCRAPGRRAISRRCHLQQAPIGHECPPLEETDDIRCRHWQTITEEEHDHDRDHQADA